MIGQKGHRSANRLKKSLEVLPFDYCFNQLNRILCPKIGKQSSNIWKAINVLTQRDQISNLLGDVAPAELVQSLICDSTCLLEIFSNLFPSIVTVP